MMKIRIRVACLLAVIASMVLLTGCHGSRGMDPFEMPETLDESQSIEISFWAKNDTNKAQTAIYNQAITDFQKEYPNIKVNIRLYTDYGRIYNDVITNISTNTTPNVCITYPDHIATYLTGVNQVVPLEDLFDNSEYGLGGSKVKFDAPTKDEIIGKYLDECSFDGHYYAVPYMRSTEALYINKTYVEKMGYEVPDVLTWDYIWEVSEAAMKQDASGNYEVNGQKTLIPFIYKSTDNMLITYLKQAGAGYSTDAGEIEIFNDTTADLLKEVATHGKSGAFSTFKISSYPGNFLNAGQCLFAIDSTAGSTWMGADAPLQDISADQIVDFETVVRPIPQIDTDSIKMISQGPSICVFNKTNPQEVLASWLFIQYLLTDDVQIGYASTEGYVPVTSKARATDRYQEYLDLAGTDKAHYQVKIDATKLLLNNTENTFVTQVFNGSASLRDAAGTMIENSVKRVRRGGVVDDKFIDGLYDDMNSLYRLDQIAGRNAMASGNMDFGPLPSTSVALLVGILIAWLFIGFVFISGLILNNKK